MDGAEAFGYLQSHRVPAVYPRLVGFFTIDIESTGQKSQSVNISASKRGHFRRWPQTPASKPLAHRIKKAATSHPTMRAGCIAAAQKADTLYQTAMAPARR
jgi:hypothetical protein